MISLNDDVMIPPFQYCNRFALPNLEVKPMPCKRRNGQTELSVHNLCEQILMWTVYMRRFVFFTVFLAYTGTLPAAEFCKLKQYRDGELVARESVLVIDREDSFSVRTSQSEFNSPLLVHGYAVDRQGVEYRHGTMESGKLWITLPWLKISLHIDCN